VAGEKVVSDDPAVGVGVMMRTVSVSIIERTCDVDDDPVGFIDPIDRVRTVGFSDAMKKRTENCPRQVAVEEIGTSVRGR